MNNDLIELVKKTKGVDIKNLKKVSLYNPSDNWFMNEVFMNRFLYFCYMKLLEEFEANYYIGGTKVYDEFEEYLGASISIKSFSKEQLFEYFLYRVGISSIIVNNELFDVEFETLVDKYKTGYPEPDYFLAVTGDKKVLAIGSDLYLENVSFDFEKILSISYVFLKKYKDAMLIPHEVYVDILLALFPEKIKLKYLK